MIRPTEQKFREFIEENLLDIFGPDAELSTLTFTDCHAVDIVLGEHPDPGFERFPISDCPKNCECYEYLVLELVQWCLKCTIRVLIIPREPTVGNPQWRIQTFMLCSKAILWLRRKRVEVCPPTELERRRKEWEERIRKHRKRPRRKFAGIYSVSEQMLTSLPKEEGIIVSIYDGDIPWISFQPVYDTNSNKWNITNIDIPFSQPQILLENIQDVYKENRFFDEILMRFRDSS